MLAADALHSIVRRATLAASSHDIQPCRFRLASSAIDLPAGQTCALPVDDPFGREFVIGCGASLMTVRAAAADAGLGARVHLLPEGPETDLPVRIELIAGAPDPELAAPARCIEQRRTHRKAVGDAAVAQAVVRRFDLGNGVAVKDQLLTASPWLTVLTTAGDDVRTWLAAGQALQRALLTDCRHGLQASHLNQPIEVTALRARLQSLLGTADHPRLPMRWGHPTGAVPPAPRRPLDAVLEAAAN